MDRMTVHRFTVACLLLPFVTSAAVAQAPYDVYGPQPAVPAYTAPPAAPAYTAPPAGPAYTAPPAGPAYTAPPAAPAYTAPPAAPAYNPWNTLNQARALIQQNQPQQALPLVLQFIKDRPLEPEGYFWQGVALDNLHKTQDALIAYHTGIQQVLKAGMDSAELRVNAANDLFKLGNLDQAIVQYRRAAQIDPGLPIVQLNLGRALTEKGDVDGALECFQRCEELHFKPYQLSYYRAKALKRAGRTQDAKAQVLTALSLLSDRSDTSAQLRQEFSDLLNTQ